jgi:hypothetical protein
MANRWSEVVREVEAATVFGICVRLEKHRRVCDFKRTQNDETIAVLHRSVRVCNFKIARRETG